MTSVQELQAQLDEARKQEKAAQKAAEQHARERERALAAFERAQEPRVRDLEQRVAAAVAEPDASVPGLRERRIARQYSRGSLRDVPQFWSGEDVIASADASAARCFGAANEAAALVEQLTDVTADLWLGADHELVQRADRCEQIAWRAFAARVQVMAGE